MQGVVKLGGANAGQAARILPPHQGKMIASFLNVTLTSATLLPSFLSFHYAFAFPPFML